MSRKQLEEMARAAINAYIYLEAETDATDSEAMTEWCVRSLDSWYEQAEREEAERDRARRWARAWRDLAHDYRAAVSRTWLKERIIEHRDRAIERVTRDWWRATERAKGAEARVAELEGAIAAFLAVEGSDAAEFWYAPVVSEAVPALRAALEKKP